MHNKDIVILHGWNLDSTRYRALADIFKKRGFRVHAPDFPGFGSASAPPKSWHVVDYAEYLRDYLNVRHIKQSIFIGHSFGGRVALKFTELYPASTKALVLTGTPGFSPVPSKKLLFFLILSKAGGALFALPFLNLLADYARRFLYYIAGSREFFRAEGNMRQTFKHVVQDNLLSAMQSVRVPCLLIWGEYDVIVPLAIGMRMRETIPNADLKIVSEADHGVPFKNPSVFASYVTSFLDTIAGK